MPAHPASVSDAHDYRIGYLYTHVWYMCVCTCVVHVRVYVCVCVLGGGGKHDDLELYYTASHRLKYNHMGGDIRWLRRDRLIYREEGQTLH